MEISLAVLIVAPWWLTISRAAAAGSWGSVNTSFATVDYKIVLHYLGLSVGIKATINSSILISEF